MGFCFSPPFFCVTTDTPFRQPCINNPPTFKVGYICCSFPLLKIPALILFDFIHAKVILNSTNGGAIAGTLLNMAGKCSCRTYSQRAGTIAQLLALLCSLSSPELLCRVNCEYFLSLQLRNAFSSPSWLGLLCFFKRLVLNLHLLVGMTATYIYKRRIT